MFSIIVVSFSSVLLVIGEVKPTVVNGTEIVWKGTDTAGNGTHGNGIPSFSLLDCDFEKDLCNWRQDTTDDADWYRHRSQTPSFYTGPSGDHTTGKGYYVYSESSSPRQVGDTARLISDLESVCQRNMNLTLWYHMGSTGSQLVGNLSVYSQKFSGERTCLWTQSKNQGSRWQQVVIQLPSLPSQSLIIEAVVNPVVVSDIAVDDISMQVGDCLGDFEPDTATQTSRQATTTPYYHQRCPLSDSRFIMPADQDTIEVRVPYSDLSLRLGPGNHTVYFNQANCSADIEVVKEKPAFSCNNEDVILSTDPTSKNIAYTWSSSTGEDNYQLNLTRGVHLLRQQRGSGEACYTRITVIDENYVTILGIRTTYAADCSLLTNTEAFGLLETVATSKQAQIDQICDYVCAADRQKAPLLTCAEDVLQATWLTNQEFIPSTGIPENINRVVLPNLLKRNDLLNLILLNGIPPVLVPQLKPGGHAAELVLVEVCLNGGEFDPVKKTCV